MTPYINSIDSDCLKAHRLADFNALWQLTLSTVDEPNSERGGVSTVCTLTLDGQDYFLKRQSNHLTRTLTAPLGEPTFAREFRNICRYTQLGIPTVTVAFFGTRQQDDQKQAILMTRALTGYHDLDHYLANWPQLPQKIQCTILSTCGVLAKQLHQKKIFHGCFYPKHIFLKENQSQFEPCLIDLEKTRPLYLGRRDRLKDLETLVRRTKDVWSNSDYRLLLSAYLEQPANSPTVTQWLQQLEKRYNRKVITS